MTYSFLIIVVRLILLYALQWYNRYVIILWYLPRTIDTLFHILILVYRSTVSLFIIIIEFLISVIRQKVWSKKILLLLFSSSGDCWDCVCAQVALARVHTRERAHVIKLHFVIMTTIWRENSRFCDTRTFINTIILSSARLVQQLLTRVNDLSSNDFCYFSKHIINRINSKHSTIT